jgi:hypothetical protein
MLIWFFLHITYTLVCVETYLIRVLFLRIFHPYYIVTRAGIAQSVQLLATGWTTHGSEFQPRYGQEYSLLHVVQTGFGDHPDSYTMGTGGSFSGVKWPGREADH